MDGFINLFKPKGYTSNDALNIIRRYFRGTKVGHGGTLDPGATGVLPVCLGNVTKLQDLIMGGDKEYETDIVFGVNSPTLDADGEVVVTDPDLRLDENAVKQVLPDFIGKQEQVPPAVSAIKQDGVALYKRARRGETVTVAPRQIEIYGIKLLSFACDGERYRVRLRVSCSKGTYIRALARDIGKALGTDAIVDDLCRLRSGAFRIEEAIPLAQLEEGLAAGDRRFILPPATALAAMPHLDLDDGIAMQTLRNGGTVAVADAPDGRYAVYDPFGALFAVGTVGDGVLKSDISLWSPRRRRAPVDVLHDPVSLPYDGDTAVVIGNFDGVHIGHRGLIERCVKEAEQAGLMSLAVTFTPHPAGFFAPERFRAVSSEAEKVEKIAACGVDAVVILTFDAAFAALTPTAFVEDILVKRLRCRHIVVGDDFTFGKDGVGDGDALKVIAAGCGVDVTVVRRLTYRGIPVGSGRIRELLAAGNVTEAGRLLGGPYTIEGEVIHGKELGRTLGFPTANLALPPDRVAPKAGVYVATVMSEGQRYEAVACIGHRPTVEQAQTANLEAHLLDADVDLYGKTVAVSLLTFLREERTFADVAALKDAIATDKAAAKNFFAGRRKKTCKK